MAASLLCSPATSHRAGLACVRRKSYHMHRGIMCFSVYSLARNCNPKHYKISIRAGLRGFTRVNSLEIDGVHGHASSNVSTPHGFQRSRTLHDCSSTSSDGVNDFERHLQELFDEIKAMIAKGNKVEALDLLQANYEAAREQMDEGARGIEEAAILDVISLGYMAVGNLKMVASLLDMLNEVVAGLNDEEPLLGAVLLHMGSMYSTLGKFEKSVRMYERVLEILERIYGKDSTLLASPLLGIAKALGFTGKATKAIEHYHRAIMILESSRGADSEDLVVPLFGLGNLLIKEGRATDAENPFSRILDIYTKLYGENDGRTGMAMCSLAHAKSAKGKVDEAITLYRSALQVNKDSKFVALDDAIMEKMRIDLVELLHVAGRDVEGRKLLEECLLITEQHKGTEHPSSVTHLINLATSYSRSKNFVEAERLLKRSLQIMMKGVEPDDQSITYPMLHLAVTLYHLNRDKEAEDLALEVLRIREKAFGKESVPVGEALDCLVPIQMRLGREDSKLLELLQRVLRIQEKEFGHESEEVIETLKKILFFLDKMGRKDDKFPLRRRLSMLRKKYKQMVKY